MTTSTQAPVATNQTPLVQAQGVVSGLQSYIETPVINTMNYPKLAGTILTSYVVLEVLNHAVLGAYVLPYLTATVGLSMGVASAITYGALALTALGLSWVAYKLFFKKKVTPIDPNTKFVPVNNSPTS